MTGSGRELGGSFALGPWHVRLAGHGAMLLAGDGSRGAVPYPGELGTVLWPVPFSRMQSQKDWRRDQ